MKKIWNWLTHWGKDKVLHFALCLVISMAAACIIRICGGDRYSAMGGAWFAGFFAGVARNSMMSGSTREPMKAIGLPTS